MGANVTISGDVILVESGDEIPWANAGGWYNLRFGMTGALLHQANRAASQSPTSRGALGSKLSRPTAIIWLGFEMRDTVSVSLALVIRRP